MDDKPWIAQYPGGVPASIQPVPGINGFAGVLDALGVGARDRVGLILPNCPQHVIAYYATLRLGAVVVGNNPLYTERELTHQLHDAGAAIVVVLDALYPASAGALAAVGVEDVIVTKITDYMGFPKKQLAPIKLRKMARHEGEPWPPVPAGGTGPVVGRRDAEGRRAPGSRRRRS